MGRLSPADFHTVCGFRRPDVTPMGGPCQVRLRSGLSLHHPRRIRSLGAARLGSTPSRLMLSPGLARDCHFKVSPTLSSSASPVSQTSTQVFFMSAAQAIPPRPRGCLTAFSMVGQDRPKDTPFPGERAAHLRVSCIESVLLLFTFIPPNVPEDLSRITDLPV